MQLYAKSDISLHNVLLILHNINETHWHFPVSMCEGSPVFSLTQQ